MRSKRIIDSIETCTQGGRIKIKLADKKTAPVTDMRVLNDTLCILVLNDIKTLIYDH